MFKEDINFDYSTLKWVKIIERKEREIYYKWLPYITVDIYNLWHKYAPINQRPTLNETLKMVNEESVVFTLEEEEYMVDKAKKIIDNSG